MRGLRATLRAAVAAAAMAAVVVAPVAAETPLAAQPGLVIRVGQADQFSRVEFRWSGGRSGMRLRRDGQVLRVSFARDAHPDLAALKSAPIKWVKSVDVRHDKGALAFVFALADGADAQTGAADGADFVNFFGKPAAPATPAPVETASARPDPAPVGGVVVMGATVSGQQLRLDFPWRNPCGAAVFRRGDAIWIVFDATARLDVGRAPKDAPQYASMQTYAGPGYSAVRIATRTPLAVTAGATGSDWTVTLQPADGGAVSPLQLKRDDSGGPAALTTAMAGASAMFWIDDPAVGDRIGVVTALAPAKGLASERSFVQFTLLKSAQGLAVEPKIDNLSVAFSGDIVTLSRPGGLTLSGLDSKLTAAQAMDAPRPAARAGLFGADWDKTGPGGFIPRYQALTSPVADEEGKGQEGSSSAHMALARFLIGEGLSFEAIGVLDDAFRTHPGLGGDAEFRALHGMARIMAGRYKEAQTDLASPSLDDNPAASLWKGYVLAKTSRWDDARKAFTAGAPALSDFPPAWKQRFARAAAETAMALNDPGGARSWINYALRSLGDPSEDPQTRLVDAEVAQRAGDPSALARFQALTASPLDNIAGPALLHVTQIQLAGGQTSPTQAIETYESLRYRWRGGTFELETARALGQLYLSQGSYREALEAFRSAGKNLPDLPEATQLQADLSGAFKRLFLDGVADGLPPIQALALFYDFKELTPVGADGDAMVRRLTRRLVDVDLLPQAEQLLQYQVDKRLDGVPKAQVATDLAVIYLMDRRPEDALIAINTSRTTVLPSAMNLQRRVIAARALTGVGEYDTALEMLGPDASADAIDARAEIEWRQKNWPASGAIFEKMLGERYRQGGPLAAEQEGQLLRAAVAYSLADDDASLARLRQRWSPFVAGARNPDALRVALQGISDGAVSPADLGRIAADNQTFAGWVAKMKQRFRQAPLPSPRPAMATRQAAGDGPAPANPRAKA